MILGFPCPYCLKLLKYRANLNVHIRDHHCDSKAIHQCSYCDKSFKSSGSLRDHKSKYHKFVQFHFYFVLVKRMYCLMLLILIKGEFKTVFLGLECHYCGKVFSSNCNLRTHVRDIHENFSSYICPFCDKVFKSKNTLANHKSLYHKNS